MATLNEIKEVLLDEYVEIDTRGKGSGYKDVAVKKIRNKDGKWVYLVPIEELNKSSNVKVKVVCSECKEVRSVRIQNLYNYKTLLCKKCNNRKHRKHKPGDTNKNGVELVKYLEYPNGIFICPECKKEYKAIISHVFNRQTSMCGKCSNNKNGKKNMTNLHRKKGHWIKEDHSDEENREHTKLRHFYFTEDWITLRDQIRKEQPNCKICGEPTEHIHHLYSRFYFPEYELEKEYLVGLCKSCHSSYHAQTNETTPETFKQWAKRRTK